MDERGAVDILDIDGVERIEGYSALRADSGALVVSFGLNKGHALFDQLDLSSPVDLVGHSLGGWMAGQIQRPNGLHVR